MPCSSPRRCRPKPAHPPAAAGAAAARDWASLPRDVLSTIFLRLGPCREIMRGAEFACAAWRRAAVEDPGLWRRVDIDVFVLAAAGLRKGWRAMLRAAVDRGAGRCEHFSGPCDEELLLYLVERAPSLKSLRLLEANTSYEALNEAIQKLSSLEELELIELRTRFVYKEYKELIQLICEACPNLKRLSVTVHRSRKDCIYHREKCVIPVMSELRSLELTLYDFTVNESMGMVDNCPLLESLHVNCFNKKRYFVKELRERCAAKNLTVTSDLDEECVVEEAEPSKEQPELGRGKRARKSVDRLNYT